MGMKERLVSVGSAALDRLSSALSHARPLDVGAQAPRLAAPDSNGQNVDLGTLYDRGAVLVFFFPRAGSPGCTAQACSLRDGYTELAQRGVSAVGVSPDPLRRLSDFGTRQRLPFTLLGDCDFRLADAFGVPHPLHVPARQSFLIENGRVVWRDLSASTRSQAQDVLAFLQSRDRA